MHPRMMNDWWFAIQGTGAAGFLYYINHNERALYQLDKNTSISQRVHPTNQISANTTMTGMTWDGAQLYGVGEVIRNKWLYTIDRETGLNTVVNSANQLPVGPDGLTWNGSTLCLMTNLGSDSQQIVEVDRTTGRAGTQLFRNLPGSWWNVAWDGTDFYSLRGRILYRITIGSSEAVRVHPTNEVGTEGSFRSLVWDGENFYAINWTTVELFRIDRNTGTGVKVHPTRTLGSRGTQIHSLAFIPHN